MKLRRVYFHCWGEPDCFQNDIIVLAEGFRELGVPYFSDVNYWRRSLHEDDWLIRATPDVKPDDCDVVVVSSWWFHWHRTGVTDVQRRPMPASVLRPKNERTYTTVYLDHNDGYITPSFAPEFQAFDIILRGKFNRRAYNPPNARPWADALQQRMIDSTTMAPPFEKRKRAIFVSYNASHSYPHGTRTWAISELHPRLFGLLESYQPPHADIGGAPASDIDALYWQQTNGRHSPEYFDRLKSCQACSAFCGEIWPSLPYMPRAFCTYGGKARLKQRVWRGMSALDPRPDRVFSFDSFRFWETLAAGTVAFHVDLDRYGATLPVQPENWNHYIGVNLDDPEETIDRIKSDPDCLRRIGEAGRKWALEHYSPAAVAKRFLQIVP